METRFTELVLRILSKVKYSCTSCDGIRNISVTRALLLPCRYPFCGTVIASREAGLEGEGAAYGPLEMTCW